MSAAPAGGPPDSERGLIGWLERRVNLTEIFSFVSHFGLVFTPVDASRPLRETLRAVARQPIPDFARWPRVLGLLAAIGFGIQALTGVLLAFYYRPTPDAAFESTRTIVRDLPLGWFIHQMHAWGAWLLVAIVALRLLRLFWDGLYRAPREVLWLAAVGLAWLALQSDFTGRLLTWDAHSYWSAVRGMEVVYALPGIGPMLAFLLGGKVVNDDVLIRFYVLHVIVLPIAYAALIYLTFATLRRVGLAPPSVAASVRTSSFRDHLYSMTIANVLLFGVLVTLAVLLPFRFLAAADPYATPGGVRPPWYMWAPYAVLRLAPGPQWLWGLLLVAVAFAVLLVPFWVRAGDERAQARLRIAGLAAFAVWLALSAAALTLDRR